MRREGAEEADGGETKIQREQSEADKEGEREKKEERKM